MATGFWRSPSTGRAALALALVAFALPSGPSAAQQFTMKIGTATINDIQHEWMKRFQARLHAKAGDRVKIQLFPSSQLGKIPRMIEGMQLGTIESFVTPSVFLVGVDQRNQVPWASGIFKSTEHCWRTVGDDGFRDYWFHLMDHKGITAISIMCSADQAFLTKKDIRRLDDFKNLKIRVLASELEIKPLQAVGMHPTPMAFSEVLPSLQRNVIDGLSSIPILFYNMKMHNAARHITLTGLFKANVPVYVSKVWWDKLPADLRALMMKESREVETELVAWNTEANRVVMDSWKKAGGTIRSLPAEDQARLLATVKPIVAKVMAKTPAVNETFRKIMEFAKANE